MDEKIFALIIIFSFFSAMIGIGVWFSKRSSQNSDEYILAGRQAPLFIVIGSIFATWVNSATLMGYGGTGYSVGIAGYWSGGAFMITCMWLGFWVIPKLRKTGITTIPELFERYFGVSHRVVAVILGLGRDLGVTAGISIALAIIFQNLFGVSLNTALIITVGVVVIYSATGGMWAVLITDTIQGALIIIGTTIMIPLGISKAGGFEAFVQAVPSTHSNIMNAGIPQSVGWLLTGIFITVAYQTLIQRGLSAKDDETARKSFIYGGLICILWYMVPFVLGIIANVLYPDIAPNDAFLQLTGLYGPYAGIFFIVVLLASCMSTISSCILTITSNISLDVYKRLINPNVSNRRLVTVQRICLIFITIIAVFIGKSLPYILELLWLGGRIMAAGLAPVFLAIIFWPASRQAAKTTMIAMISGSLVTIYWQLVGSKTVAADEGVVFLWKMDPILYGLPVTILVLLIGVFLEKKRSVQ
jgi:SSS family solute:Na+ symporter